MRAVLGGSCRGSQSEPAPLTLVTLPALLPAASNALVVSFVLAFIAAGFQLVQAASMIANRHSFSGGAQREWAGG